jgi:hypothetical protein
MYRKRIPMGEVDAKGNEITPPGGLSREVLIKVDKNTMGRVGTFKQIMVPEMFTMADIYKEPSNKNGTDRGRKSGNKQPHA